MGSKYDAFIPVINYLHDKHLTDVEIANCIGIDPRRVGSIRNRLNLSRNNPSEKEIHLSDDQEQVLIGGIIGDMCIFKDKNAEYHRMNLAHSIKQKHYLLLKSKILGELFYKPSERRWIDKRTNKAYGEIRIQSITHKIFSDLYQKWYKNGKKVIHDDIWKLNELGLAILYFDDGYKQQGGYEISLDEYSTEDISKIKSVLENKFLLVCTTPKNGRVIRIKAASATYFKEIISKYITVDTEYKL